MTDLEFKRKLINTGLFKFIGNSRYTCKCPFCNDNKGHMYVLIDLNSDAGVCYYCFKCNSKGYMNKIFLDYFDIQDIVIPKTKARRRIDETNSVSSTNTNIPLVDESHDVSGICSYIESRVGHYPTLTELQYFQYVANPLLYVKEYLGEDTFKSYNRLWFKMTNGNLIGRDPTDASKISWYKHKTKINERGLYTIKLPFDLYQPINVYIAEGIMDVIGLYYNYRNDNNIIYIAAMGRDYVNAIKHIISLGIFGNSVSIKIFKDSDVDNVYIDENIKSLFKKIDIYKNLIGKDYGLLPDKMDIQKCII